MPMILGSEMPRDIQQRLLGIYVHRFTKEHVPQWARVKRPDGTSYMPQFSSDADWLRHTKFRVTNAGVLDARSRFCESSPTWPDGQNEKRSNPSRGYKWHLALRHDRGTVVLETWATSKTAAINTVMRSEGCPRSAIIKVSKVRY